MKKRFLVIGSNSFSGAYFVKDLLERDNEVLGVSRSAEPHEVLLPYKWQSFKSNFSFHQIDINSQLEDLLKQVNEFKPEYVVNFAAQGMVAQSWDTPEHWYQTNVVGQVKLHDKLRKLSYLKKYVHVTTPEAYGSTDGWIQESFQFAPSTPYAVSRAACDLHLMSFLRPTNFQFVLREQQMSMVLVSNFIGSFRAQCYTRVWEKKCNSMAEGIPSDHSYT